MKINLDPKVNPKKDDLVIAVDSTGIKGTNSDENGYLTNGRISEKGKVLSKYMLLQWHTNEENSFNWSNKRKCSWWKDTKGISSQCFWE